MISERRERERERKSKRGHYVKAFDSRRVGLMRKSQRIVESVESKEPLDQIDLASKTYIG
jgi:hypothetical protein